MPLEDKCAQIWREAFQSAAAFASPSPRNGVHRRGDRIFSRMMDLEGEAIQQCDRELAKLHEANERMTNPKEPTLTCSEVVERLAKCKWCDKPIHKVRRYNSAGNEYFEQWAHALDDDATCTIMVEPADIDSWRERRVQELEELLAKRSGCPHCKDSASGRTSANDSTETRKSKPLIIEIERETDGRWLADVPSVPGIMAYGSTRTQAAINVLALLDAE